MKRNKYLLIVIILIFLIPSYFMSVSSGYNKDKDFNALSISLLNQLDLMRIYNVTEDLSSYNTRLTGTLECNLAANYIYSTLNETFNVTDVFFEAWSYEGADCFNVVARINGTTLKDEFVIISAHYDSISIDETAPGANDNAVAVAVCMEIVRLIQTHVNLNRTLLFLAFAGEEQAFLGSQAWIQQHQGDLSKIVAVINLDMVGFGNYLTIIKNEQSDWLADLIIATAAPVNISYAKTNSLYPETARFDHDSFWSVNIPCVSLFGGGAIYPYYHTSEDTIDKISFSLVEKCAQTVLLSTLFLGMVRFESGEIIYFIFIALLWGLAVIGPVIIFQKLR